MQIKSPRGTAHSRCRPVPQPYIELDRVGKIGSEGGMAPWNENQMRTCDAGIRHAPVQVPQLTSQMSWRTWLTRTCSSWQQSSPGRHRRPCESFALAHLPAWTQYCLHCSSSYLFQSEHSLTVSWTPPQPPIKRLYLKGIAQVEVPLHNLELGKKRPLIIPPVHNLERTCESLDAPWSSLASCLQDQQLLVSASAAEWMLQKRFHTFG